jgi:hypothetical protein
MPTNLKSNSTSGKVYLNFKPEISVFLQLGANFNPRHNGKKSTPYYVD